jgi:putative DNA primase/helicase
MTSPETWFADKESRSDPALLRRLEESRHNADRKRAEDARHAEEMALGMLQRALPMTHPYLIAKGLPELKGLVLDQTLLVRMEDERGRLAGLQTIEMVDGEWKKKMLHGMKAKGASLRLGRGSDPILVEGYATGLSIDQVLQSMPSRLYVIVCFSDGNLVEVAKRYQNARVFADNDASGAGQRAAERSGKPWVASDIEGEDANDLFRRNPMELAQKVRFLSRLK